MARFTKKEERIINRIQQDIPLVSKPFGVIAGELGLDEREVLETIRSLKERRIVRNISAIFNAHRLGYHSSLIAFSVPEKRVTAAAEIINGHPGVSHNYLRNHDFNMWFTLSAESAELLTRTAATLARMCGAADHLILRNETLYKIGFMLKMGDDADDDDDDASEETSCAVRHISHNDSSDEVTDEMRRAVLLLQTDLPIESRPFHMIGMKYGGGMSGDDLISAGLDLKRRDVMRRYAAVLKHYNAGYTANAMTAWKFDDAHREEDVMHIFSSHPGISHLYTRTLYPGRWDYPLFAMIHARTDDELRKIIGDLEAQSGIRDYLVLKSLKEFKKKRVTYFSPAFGEWNGAYL